jgi:hypothetical protein
MRGGDAVVLQVCSRNFVMNTLLYLVYGDQREYQLELTYSVLSAVHMLKGDEKNFQIVLLCDAGNQRPELPIKNLVFTPEEFARWTRNGDYKHEAKIHAYDRALKLFGGKVAVVDTDTFFVKSPLELFNRIGPKRTVMHAYERLLGVCPVLGPILGKLDGVSLTYPLSAETRSFNSGVVGMDHSDQRLVQHVIGSLGEMYRIHPAFNLEQFAFSVVLDRETHLSDCADVVRHYYGYEREFIRARIARLFPEFSAELFERYVHAPPVVAGFPEMNLLDKLRARLKELIRGEGADYRFAYLAYRSAISSTTRSSIHANIWARIAGAILERSDFAAEAIRRDFSRFYAPGSLSWMDDKTRRLWTTVWGKLSPTTS